MEQNKGKDGKTFDIGRYVDWAKSEAPSHLNFPQKMKDGSTGANKKHLKRLFCPYCFECITSGGTAFNKHKRECLKKPK